jgi:hypothetical protein
MYLCYSLYDISGIIPGCWDLFDCSINWYIVNLLFYQQLFFSDALIHFNQHCPVLVVFCIGKIKILLILIM